MIEAIIVMKSFGDPLENLSTIHISLKKPPLVGQLNHPLEPLYYQILDHIYVPITFRYVYNTINLVLKQTMIKIS